MIKYSISDQTPVTFRNLRSYVDNKWRTKFPNVTTFIQKRNRAPHLCLFDYFITCQRHVYATSLVEGRRNERKGEREREREEFLQSRERSEEGRRRGEKRMRTRRRRRRWMEGLGQDTLPSLKGGRHFSRRARWLSCVFCSGGVVAA